ncbi:MAG: sugar ABC transporter permease [Euzebyales bacterium]|nr:sugar ABC transporter permease [Euzebyales bacterium]
MLYPVMLPLFGVTAAAGAAVGIRAWRAAGYSPRIGAVVGATAGLLGPLITMVPLRGCTFEPGRGPVDVALGVVAFGVGGAVAIGASAWVARTIARETGRVRTPAQQLSAGSFRAGIGTPLAFLAPTLAVLVLFLYWPMLETLRLSTRLVRLSAPNQPFVCLDNFTKLMAPTFSPLAAWLTIGFVVAAGIVAVLGRSDQDSALAVRVRGWLGGLALLAWTTAMFGANYRGVFVTTLILTAGTVIVGLIAGLAIAVLVSQPVKGQGAYRTFLIWPYAISPPIAGILFFVIFDPLAGIAGHLVETFTPFTLPSYRADGTLARSVVILASVWKTLGFNILFYVAGLQNVPTDVIEAGQIDGANTWQRFRHLVLPSLSPITFFLIVTNVTYAFFEVFGTITYLTAGGPSGATTDAMSALIRAGQVQGSFGDGAAQSLILFAMVLAVTFWQFRVTGRRVSYGS